MRALDQGTLIFSLSALGGYSTLLHLPQQVSFGLHLHLNDLSSPGGLPVSWELNLLAPLSGLFKPALFGCIPGSRNTIQGHALEF